MLLAAVSELSVLHVNLVKQFTPGVVRWALHNLKFIFDLGTSIYPKNPDSASICSCSGSSYDLPHFSCSKSCESAVSSRWLCDTTNSPAHPLNGSWGILSTSGSNVEFEPWSSKSGSFYETGASLYGLKHVTTVHKKLCFKDLHQWFATCIKTATGGITLT